MELPLHASSRAQTRMTTFYHHLFPDLIDERNLFPEDTPEGLQQRARYYAQRNGGGVNHHHTSQLEAVGCVALGSEFEIPLEDVRKGWLSQPEELDYELEVQGELPMELRGTLYRNGPGLLDVYGTPLVHPIDGDGMVCALMFNNGRVHFRNRYVNTVGYAAEKKAKKLIFKGMMGTEPPLSWGESLSQWTTDIGRGKMPNQRFKNPANTNCYYWGGKVLACWESGLPYELDPVTLETKGKTDLNGALKDARCLAAHYRYCPFTNRLVSFSFQLTMSGKCKLFIHEFDHQFNIVKQQEHQIEEFYYCHDFLLTENYYIFLQPPFYDISRTNVAKIVTGTSAPGELMRWYPHLPCRVIVIPREEGREIRHLDTEPTMVYHHLNAYEQDDKIFFTSVCIGTKFNMEFEDGVSLSNSSVAPGLVYNYTVDLTQNTVTRVKADFTSCEFPSIHPLRNGLPYRFGYLMASDSPQKPTPYQEIVKFDRDGFKRQVWSARPEFGVLGEPVFIPRNGNVQHLLSNPSALSPLARSPVLSQEREDEGWVVAQLFNCKTYKTEFVVLDAQDMEKGPIARVKLAHHTPYGFHGTFAQCVGHQQNHTQPHTNSQHCIT
eukprot:TRINITY_DN3615_c0_g1_i1.p1 TRINITY_DN3615_c0_g1~~TRINITY_DN3615_c0_g1_i1.p1  ORF type:complete len:606 (+),score=93.57 TRINITY_DN3615_c0_g1_i1:69-1886(+)